MITVTENAKNHALSLMKAEARTDGTFIRVGVEGGGCSGLSYKLEFDHNMREGDQVFEDKGIKIVVDKKSFLYLVGTQLDYTGGLNGKGFGESFAV
jgi:iron-sulfur cluster assembly protein